MEAHCASETALSLGARPCSDVPIVAFNRQQAFVCALTRTRYRVFFLSGGGAARALAACACRAALVGVGPCPIVVHCVSETALSCGFCQHTSVSVHLIEVRGSVSFVSVC